MKVEEAFPHSMLDISKGVDLREHQFSDSNATKHSTISLPNEDSLRSRQLNVKAEKSNSRIL